METEVCPVCQTVLNADGECENPNCDWVPDEIDEEGE